jgi:hypothetical protein
MKVNVKGNSMNEIISNAVSTNRGICILCENFDYAKERFTDLKKYLEQRFTVLSCNELHCLIRVQHKEGYCDIMFYDPKRLRVSNCWHLTSFICLDYKPTQEELVIISRVVGIQNVAYLELKKEVQVE